jgi:hypothetical protein
METPLLTEDSDKIKPTDPSLKMIETDEVNERQGGEENCVMVQVVRSERQVTTLHVQFRSEFEVNSFHGIPDGHIYLYPSDWMTDGCFEPPMPIR